MKITLTVKDNYYKDTTDKKQKLIKRNVRSNIIINTDDIIMISECLSNRGNVLKNFCRIHIREIGDIIVNHSRKEIVKIGRAHV